MIPRDPEERIALVVLVIVLAMCLVAMVAECRAHQLCIGNHGRWVEVNCEQRIDYEDGSVSTRIRARAQDAQLMSDLPLAIVRGRLSPWRRLALWWRARRRAKRARYVCASCGGLLGEQARVTVPFCWGCWMGGVAPRGRLLTARRLVNGIYVVSETTRGEEKSLRDL